MKKGITLELRAAEGGQDSKLIVEDMAAVYIKAAERKGFSVETTNWREGYISLWIAGKGSKKYFQNEQGGHRFQRIPPTERKGRIHTSSITVLDKSSIKEMVLDKRDVDVWFTKGTGPGGQRKTK